MSTSIIYKKGLVLSIVYSKRDNKYYGYIYKISNTINDKIYIGQTRRTVECRWKQHLREGNTSEENRRSKSFLYRSMYKYGTENFYIETIETLTGNTKKELCDKLNNKEKYYIKELNTLIPNGYNIAPGGFYRYENKNYEVDQYSIDGEFISTYDSATQALCSVADINDKDGTTNHISECCNGKLHTTLGYVWRYKGEPFDKYSCQHVAERSVDQYDMYGNYLNTYNTIKDASVASGASRGGIRSCCNGKSLSAKGYIWRFAKEDLYSQPVKLLKPKVEKPKRELLCDRPVDKYDLSGNLLASYDHCYLACKDIDNEKTRTTHILECCEGVVQTAYGFVWRYPKDTINFGDEDDKRFSSIDQYDIDGNLIKTWDNIHDAANSYHKKGYTSDITKVCTGKKITFQGYIWRYHEDAFDKYPTRHKKEQRPIIVLTFDKNYQDCHVYESAEEAAHAIGHKYKGTVCTVCKTNRFYKDRYWFYATDEKLPPITQEVKNKIKKINNTPMYR